MDPVHLLVKSVLADHDLHISKGDRQTALFIYVDRVRVHIVLIQDAQKFKRQVQSILVSGQNLFSGIGMCEDYSIDLRRLLEIPAGYRLDHPLLGEVNIPASVVDTGIQGLLLNIDPDSRWINDVYINLVNEGNILHLAVMVLQSHHKGVFSHPSACNEGFDLLLAVLGISIDRSMFEIKEHDDKSSADCRGGEEKCQEIADRQELRDRPQSSGRPVQVQRPPPHDLPFSGPGINARPSSGFYSDWSACLCPRFSHSACSKARLVRMHAAIHPAHAADSPGLNADCLRIGAGRIRFQAADFPPFRPLCVCYAVLFDHRGCFFHCLVFLLLYPRSGPATAPVIDLLYPRSGPGTTPVIDLPYPRSGPGTAPVIKDPSSPLPGDRFEGIVLYVLNRVRNIGHQRASKGFSPPASLRLWRRSGPSRSPPGGKRGRSLRS